MSSETILSLIDNFTCDYVMAGPEEPDSLNALLPWLTKLYEVFVDQSLDKEADDVSRAKVLIDLMITDQTDDIEKTGNELNQLVTALITSVKQKEQEINPGWPEDTLPGKAADAGMDSVDRVDNALAAFADHVIHFEVDNGDGTETLCKIADTLTTLSEDIDSDTFKTVATACHAYLQALENVDSGQLEPVEEAVCLLKAVLKHVRSGEAFSFDYTDVLTSLNIGHDAETTQASTEAIPPKKPLEAISDDDLEVLTDFISEAGESLDNVEVNLIDLEQDPANMDIINEIFRTFHTIKGVAGFMALDKVNILAHATENLLDSARSGEFVINQAATDAILSSVDLLKKLFDRLNQSVQSGYKQPDTDIVVSDLQDRLQRLQVTLSKGGKEPVGEILVRNKALDQESLDQALASQKNTPDKKIGEILIDTNKVQPQAVASALMTQAKSKTQVESQVKVSTRKLDDLVDYAGELVIAQSMLRQKTAHDPGLSQSVNQLGQIVNNMQSIAMSMRMIPIKSTFMKMIRLVRDLARKSGKDVALSMEGEETEIDRNVVDALYEPMVHMIRNSVDHGIESEADRMAAGKSGQGTIYLRAYHKGGNIVIEIEDDGKGLDTEKIVEKAVAGGIITGQEQMTDAQIYDLILQPGFSTASEITDISGRGVGMDVVRESIEQFRGHLEIDSEKGKGTQFTINLPLTMAIIDGMLVRLNDEKYVIPTMSIQKAFKPGKNEFFTVEGKGEMVKDRGSLVPMVRLDEIYGNGGRRKSIEDSLVVVVESKGEKRALLIDELLGKDEFVIKSLGGSLEDVRGIAGGAILGDGRVGLILDIHGLFAIVAGDV